MLPDFNRLRKTKEIERIFKEGRGLKEDGFFIRAAKNNLNLNRFAFIAGQKASKKAVERNRVKRVLRETIRGKRESIKLGYDVIISALQGSSAKSREEIDQTLTKLLKKTGLSK
jgi:ribonuclease P protein component